MKILRSKTQIFVGVLLLLLTLSTILDVRFASAGGDLRVFLAYQSPVREKAGVVAKITNVDTGNGTGTIKSFKLLDLDDAFHIKLNEPFEQHTLSHGDNYFLNYTITGKKLGYHAIAYEMTWEDDEGNEYTIDSSEEPVVVNVVEVPQVEQKSDSIPYYWIGVGIAAAAAGGIAAWAASVYTKKKS
jgi:hypothetical protein